MIRNNLVDVSDEEYESIVIPYEQNLSEYIKRYALPELVAFALASGFDRNAIWQDSLEHHYNSFKDRISIGNEEYKVVIPEVKRLMEIKYSLRIINEKPLEIERIEY